MGNVYPKHRSEDSDRESLSFLYPFRLSSPILPPEADVVVYIRSLIVNLPCALSHLFWIQSEKIRKKVHA